MMEMKKPLVLVVDDDLETLQLLKLALNRAGFDTQIASNWQEVDDRILMSYQQERVINAIVLDLMMPERSGFDILRTMQVALVPMPPVIMLTAVVGTEQRIDALDLGVTKYLTKPTTPSKLVEALKEVIGKTQTGPLKNPRDKFPPKSFTR
ncbi:MAG: response regulator transcription factor [Anaerolineales bacterium]|nr:response regulator transcription factor [Anaerolineales bacterium]